MIIEFLSDIHLDATASPRKRNMSRRRGMENYDYLPKPMEDSDVLIIPGDIGPWDVDSKPFLTAFAEEHGKPVIFVPGNHEFEHGLPINHRFMSPHELVHILQFGETLTVGEFCFIGATLWAGPAITDRTRRLASRFFDFERVRSPTDPEQTMSLEEYVAQHELERDAVLRQCWQARHVAQKTPVVITHHAPSLSSTPMRFIADDCNIFFATDLNDAIHRLNDDDAAPPLWIHGHMHDPCDYTIGATRVMNQPLGYAGEAQSSPLWRPVEL